MNTTNTPKHVQSKNARHEAAQILNTTLEQSHGHPVLLMLSGGSALSILEHVDTSIISNNFTITVLDERFSDDLKINNFEQITKTKFYDLAIANGAKSIPTNIFSSGTLAEAGERFEHALRAWKQNNPNGIIIATMGIGPDGHTAGLFPHQEKADREVDFSGNAWVCAYEVPSEVNPYTQRFSVTFTFLRTCVDEAIVYAVGEEKRLIIEKIQRTNCRLEDVPASIIKELRRVTVITD
jgi:6-phosphogluconolactonase/glucosamine-6-phosphate isomerase/deaminase